MKTVHANLEAIYCILLLYKKLKLLLSTVGDPTTTYPAVNQKMWVQIITFLILELFSTFFTRPNWNIKPWFLGFSSGTEVGGKLELKGILKINKLKLLYKVDRSKQCLSLILCQKIAASVYHALLCVLNFSKFYKIKFNIYSLLPNVHATSTYMPTLGLLFHSLSS